MKLIEKTLYGATIVLGIGAFASGMQGWGAWVQKNDRATFADFNVMQARAASTACGKRAEPIKTRDGWFCLYVNPNGETLMTSPLSSPIGAM